MSALGYEYVGFQFSKQDGFAQRLCISKFQLCCFQEYNLTFQNKRNMNKFQNKVTCEEIETYFYEEVELCPIATQIAYPNHTLTQTHHKPRKLITINIQFFKMLHCSSIKS
jgi:hypothetical protein